MTRRVVGFLLPAVIAAIFPMSAKADILYGSISSSNNTQLFSINTVTNAQVALPVNTGLPYINGLAYDSITNYLYYRGGVGTTNGIGAFYRYDITNNVQTQIVPATFFTDLGISGATNAAFYNGNYWFVAQNDDLLVRFNPVTQAIDTFNNIDGSAATFAYNGDIAIDRNGILYSSSSTAFFRIDISSGTPTGYTPILTNVTSNNTNAVNRQLAFAADGLTLLGYKNVSGAGSLPWAVISTTNGTTSAAPNLTNLNNFGDLASAVAAPEANTLALVLPSLSVIGTVMLRRRKK
jgi:hypothetical protein